MFGPQKRMSKKPFKVSTCFFFLLKVGVKRVKLRGYIGGKWNFVQASSISPAKIFQKVVEFWKMQLE